jgi:hypothetical protein
MAIRYLKTYAALEGQVSAEDAEVLQHWLQEQPRPAVNLAKCEHLHAAALQVLLALKPRITKPPAERWLAAALEAVH